MCTAVYLINRLPTPILQNKSPYQLVFNQEPEYGLLKNFGCACYPCLRPYTTSKLDSLSERCVFLGYSAFHSGYRCLPLSSGRLYISRDVVFIENTYPYQEQSHPAPNTNSNDQQSFGLIESSPAITTPTSTTQVISPPKAITPVTSKASLIPISMQEAQSSPPPNPTLDSTNCIQNSTISSPNSTDSSHDISNDISPSSHDISPTGHIPSADPLSPSNLDSSNIKSQVQTRRLSDIIRRIDSSGSTSTIKFPLPTCFHTTISASPDPINFSIAITKPEWAAAMNEEFQALLHIKTWKLVPRPPKRPVIGCKWIYKTKPSAHGLPPKYKARLVAKGFLQEGGIDYHETFSPVIKVTTIRLLLSLAVSQRWQIRQLDISNAFLHGDLHELIYMDQPQGFQDAQYPHHVCQLKKSLYGLKQAPREWFHKLTSQLIHLRFQGSKTDTSLYYTLNGPIYLLIYVDDMLILGPSLPQIQQLIKSLATHFKLKDLGSASRFLGVEFQAHHDGYLLTQSQYTVSLLRTLKMENCKPLPTPCPLTCSDTSTKSVDNPQLYRQVVGALQYLLFTRPDISFAVNQACRSMHSPQSTDWIRLKHLLRYLKGTVTHGLYFTSKFSTSLTTFSDADWAGDQHDRRSTSGFLIYFGNNLISWSSKKQPTVARSSTEAEYKVIANATSEIMWITSLFRELHIVSSPPILWCDNIGATYLSANPVFHARMKHIEVDFHFGRELVAARCLRVCVIAGKDQPADLLTKPLPKSRFTLPRSKLNLLPALCLQGDVEETTNSPVQPIEPVGPTGPVHDSKDILK